MARGDKDYGDEGKTSFSKKSKMAPKASPKPAAKPAPTAAKSTKSPDVARPKARPAAPASSKRPMTPSQVNDQKTKDLRGNMAADLSLMDKAKPKKAEGEMTRQERKKAGMPVSTIGRLIAKVNSRAEAIAAKKAAEKKR